MYDTPTTNTGSFDAALANVQSNWDAALAAPKQQAETEPKALDQRSLAAFRAAAQKYNVPADVLIGMAEKDSGLDPFARSRGPGAKTRGMIKMTDEDVAKSGINPYVPEQNIDTRREQRRSARRRTHA